MDNDVKDNRWCSLKEVCLYLGVGRDTIFKWIKTREMPAVKIGRQWKLSFQILIIGPNPERQQTEYGTFK